jgi:hypothetical protein
LDFGLTVGAVCRFLFSAVCSNAHAVLHVLSRYVTNVVQFKLLGCECEVISSAFECYDHFTSLSIPSHSGVLLKCVVVSIQPEGACCFIFIQNIESWRCCHAIKVLFQCTVLNPVDLSRHVLCVSSPEQPDPPTDLELTDQKPRSVQLTWIPGDEHNSPIHSMCVRACVRACVSVNDLTDLLSEAPRSSKLTVSLLS